MLSGYDEAELKEVLMKDVETEVYELRKGATLLDKIGDFAPAWGMLQKQCQKCLKTKWI